MTKTLSDKVLLGSIAATTSITTAQAADVIPVTTLDVATWLPTDYGLAVSIIAGVVLSIERIQTIIYKVIDRKKSNKG